MDGLELGTASHSSRNGWQHRIDRLQNISDGRTTTDIK